jgi:hypothetical protein
VIRVARMLLGLIVFTREKAVQIARPGAVNRNGAADTSCDSDADNFFDAKLAFAPRHSMRKSRYKTARRAKINFGPPDT